MIWFKCEAAQHNIRKFASHSARTGIHVRGGKELHYHGINEGEEGSLRKIANNLNITLTSCEEPEYQQAPCGIRVTSVPFHSRVCKSCRQISGCVDRNGVARGVKSIIKVKGLQHFSMEGMISVLKEELEMAKVIVAEYEGVIAAIEGFPNAQKELQDAQDRIENNKKAVAYFYNGNEKVTIEMDTNPIDMNE